MAGLQLRRGTDAQRLTITPDIGEIIYTTDTQKLWIGNGTTPGGIAQTAVLPVATAGLLGGVKIGSGISVTMDGTISANTQTGAVSSVSLNGATPQTGAVALVQTNSDWTQATITSPAYIQNKPTTFPAANAGVANGVATLDANAKIPTAQLPNLAITEVFVVANQAARLALTAQVGDVAVQTDTSTTYILQTEPATANANWVQLANPTTGVTSLAFNGGTAATGAVTVTQGQSDWTQTDNTMFSFIKNKPTTFTPPVATAMVLGGVKQGTGTTIAGDGTLSVNTGVGAPWSGNGITTATTPTSVILGANVAGSFNGTVLTISASGGGGGGVSSGFVYYLATA